MDNLYANSPILMPRPGHRYARPNGGHKYHLVPLGSNTSLCGHTPTNSPHLKTKRAYWISRPDGGCAGRTCEKCLTK